MWRPRDSFQPMRMIAHRSGSVGVFLGKIRLVCNPRGLAAATAPAQLAGGQIIDRRRGTGPGRLAGPPISVLAGPGESDVVLRAAAAPQFETGYSLEHNS